MRLRVAGGTYLEKCLFPEWHELYGSGLRAALAANSLGAQVAFHTYISKDNEATLFSRAGLASVELLSLPTPVTVKFEYVHGLSTPHIWPVPLPQNEPLKIEDEAILRFGFMEGDAIVSGERVVYDPQNPFQPIAFSKNGSIAQQLAIVCNRAEGRILTGEPQPEKMAAVLREREKCAVAVIKCGSHGCVVADESGVKHVPSYKTDFVWPIGSGDVFASVFAFHWALNKQAAVEAATLASRATAFYCERMSLDFYGKAFENFKPEPFHTRANSKPPFVYLAGPFFSMSQNWLIEEAYRALEGQGLRVFSPLHHVGRGSAAEVYGKDIEGLEKSDIVFACVDGLDSGTIFEIGYAVAKGKLAVAFVQNERPEDLKMLEGARCLLEKDFVTSIYKTYWLANS